jgi:glycosyltransferase involved in cell wall biosynthesis
MEEARQMGLIRNDNTIFIGNGVNLERYSQSGSRQALRREFGVADDERLFCCVGRLDKQKGLDVLIEAYSWLNPKAHKAKLWFVGDGDLRTWLHELVRREGLLDYVKFLGFRKDIPQILSAADVFVLPSRFEAMPLSIIEAMAMGLPCIVSDTGENAFMVEDGVNGFIVQIEDVKALAEAMEQLATDPMLGKMMGRVSQEKSARYSEDITVKRIQQVYELIAPTGKALA